MHIYHYCFYLLAFIVLAINSRYIKRSSEDESNEELHRAYHYYLKNLYQPNNFERHLRNLISLDHHDADQYDDLESFERRTKAITKGDPREFMG